LNFNFLLCTGIEAYLGLLLAVQGLMFLIIEVKLRQAVVEHPKSQYGMVLLKLRMK
jgi:hypothetical protein